MSRGRAPPFKQRLAAALEAAKAAGAIRVKINADGSCEFDLTEPEAPASNDFDRPPAPLPEKRGNSRS
jgi:hypothetical protein